MALPCPEDPNEKTKDHPTMEIVKNFQTKLKTRRLVDFHDNISIEFSNSDRYSLEFDHYQFGTRRRVIIKSKSEEKILIKISERRDETEWWFTEKIRYCTMSYCKATESELNEIDNLLEEDGILQMASS